MKVSVILASFNGASTLPRTFRALADVETQGLHVEFILVDNGSTDSTASLMKEFLRYRAGTYVLESRAGKSNALNTGLTFVRGELIVLTDDDVIPKPGWLNAFAAAAKVAPETMAFAGQIRLDWPTQPSDWLLALESMGRTLGATPRNRPQGIISFSDVKGANCAFRAEALSLGETFRPDLGVNSQGPVLAGEETAFFEKMEKAGSSILFVPNAELGHIVRSHQMSIWSLIQRGIRNGRGSAAVFHNHAAPSRMHLFGIPGYGLRNVLHVGGLGLVKFIFGDRISGACDVLRAAEISGLLLESARRKH